MSRKKKTAAAIDKPVEDLQTFIQRVNRKDKHNGLKVTFGFTKRKRK